MREYLFVNSGILSNKNKKLPIFDYLCYDTFLDLDEGLFFIH